MKESIFHLKVASITHYHSCSGTIFIHTLLDGHSEIISIPGVPYLINLVTNNYSKASQALKIFMNDNPLFFDTALIQSDTLRSSGLYSLGENKSDHIITDKRTFENSFYSHIEGKVINPRNVIISIYYAYAKTHRVNIAKCKLILLHPHEKSHTLSFHRHFPESKYLVPVRDPIKTYYSILKHSRRKTKLRNVSYTPSGQVVENALDLRDFYNNGMNMHIIKFERLGEEKEIVMREVTEYLGLKFLPTLLECTFGGFKHWGDNPERVTSTYDAKWHQREIPMKKLDFLVLSAINKQFSKMMNYNYKNLSLIEEIIMPFLMVLPLEDERRFFIDSIKNIYKVRCFLNLLKYCIRYIPQRIKLIYIYFSNHFSSHYQIDIRQKKELTR